MLLEAVKSSKLRKFVYASSSSVYGDTDDLPTLPLFYNIDVVAIHQNLKNAWPRPNSSGPNSSIWGSYQWEWGGPS